ncbi:MAG: alpha-ketoglutarate-dependent dioxygenase AlkB [Bacteroidetes bacterium]|nr:alpha-ketoglutarate-dependent dioxygenase AlkB [Bacteroidota bacterium]MCB0855045.1 alpha-ketoglutarate-dependent dioxygenase AlkB [Bacteroidota bacterium]
MANIPLQNGTIYYYPDFYSPVESDTIFKELAEKIEWQQESIKIFGKKIPQPRLTAWYGDPGKTYTYSNLTWTPQSWIPELITIKEKVEKVARTRFNSVLLNYYRDGKDSMGWHSDDEPELGKNPVIASLSFGQKRAFHLKHRLDKTIPKVKLDLEHGSLLIMSGETQHFWQHQIPKTSRQVDGRINLTFRVIL